MRNILLCGVILIFFLILRFVKQKQITGFGYKSKLSMQNLTTWNEGNRYVSNFIIVGSLLSILLGFILNYMNYSNMYIVLYINIAFVLISSLFTELHLRKLFNKDGSPK
ncbi:SdpI family protein [Clostridium sp. YIM B02505]|uniref:SdpI family protein n=1 Tax=Clostridium yunnanense TaxID=2800325 RepID=A0ABS1EV80_9CLOT|nr:SdpI family protein [Clostridium yunnanense]MBK1813250.1 SdpI family protein [Clostridium yunnanense]